MKIVLCTGTFDMLHAGHIAYLEQAARLGRVVVVVARDETVLEERGRRPVVAEADRLNMIQHIDIVDDARLGNVGDKLTVVEELKPDIICLGYDQRMNVKKLEKELLNRGLQIEVRRMKPFQKKRYKSSVLKEEGIE
jgi:FAD synthetase